MIGAGSVCRGHTYKIGDSGNFIKKSPMRRPSILFINRVYPPERGASGRMLRDLARGFVRDGWNVTVLTTGAQPKMERDGAVRIQRIAAPARPRTIMGSLRLLWGLWRAGMAMPRHDLVVTLTDPPFLVVAGGMIAKVKRCRHIHWCMDLYPDLLPVLGVRMPENIYSFLSRMTRKAMRDCDRVIVVGRCMARSLTHRGFDAKQISFIPNWPDYELLATRKRAQCASAFNGGEDQTPEPVFRDVQNPKFRVLYSGNLGRAHPLETILGAAEILSETHKDIEIIFVGDGVQFERLAAERARRGLENIRLLPWQPISRLRKLMESGDVHLMSMADEAAGLLVPCKLYAALSVGRPAILIGPAHSEAGRVIDDFQAGAVVPQGEPALLADMIARFRSDGDVWFKAQEGAIKAGRIYQPDDAIRAWIERAQSVVAPDLPANLFNVLRPRKAALAKMQDKPQEKSRATAPKSGRAA